MISTDNNGGYIMLTRRTLVTSATTLPALTLAAQPAASQTAASVDVVRDWGFIPTVPLEPGSTSSPTGDSPPRFGEISKAFGLLYNAPRGQVPLEVARYFQTLPDKNQDGSPYNAEWPVKANPVIVGFFSMTNTTPSSGDQTSWCAAFLNFCLVASGREMTFSALSGSFRRYRTATETPKEGDIVVFTNTGPSGAQGFGHVAFFLSKDSSGITVLGGNQGSWPRHASSFTHATCKLRSPRPKRDLPSPPSSAAPTTFPAPIS
jgi:uncharacterized protein (TIGR02594 family)